MYSLDLNDLKIELNIDANDTGRDTAIEAASDNVKAAIEARIGAIDQTSLVWSLPGTDSYSLKLPIPFKTSLRYIDKIEITDDETTWVELPKGSYWVSLADFRVFRDSDYAGTITAPDDGVSFAIFAKIERPIKVTAICGWDSAGDDQADPVISPEVLPIWITRPWKELTILYYYNIQGAQSVLEPETGKRNAAKIRPSNWFDLEMERYFSTRKVIA